MIPLRFGRLLRTIRHLSLGQIAAQMRHTLSPAVRPSLPSGTTPGRSVERSVARFLPNPEHASWDGWLGFELIGRRIGFSQRVDWDVTREGPLWAFHLHQFDYLRDPALSPHSRWELIDDWIEQCRGGVGWSPHPISLRLLTWGKLLLTPGALKLDSAAAARLDSSLVEQAETLANHLEYRLCGNHLFSNLLGVVFAGLLYEGGRADAWLAKEAALRDEFAEQILADGSHIERSPMYHALLLENVLDLLNLARAVPERAPKALVEALEDVAARMLGAHRVWCHPDGEIALLGDSAFAIAQPLRRLEAYAESLGVEPRPPAAAGVLADAGVVRLSCGSFTMIVSAAAPQPSYQPGHAHCDALSFELSVREERVVSDTGVSEYIPGRLRAISRATASHATLEIGAEEQSEVWSAHRVGGRAEVEIVKVIPGEEILARATGWKTRDTTHLRHFAVSGGSIEIVDRIQGRSLPIVARLPFEPGHEPRLRRRGTGTDENDAMELAIDLDSGLRLEVELPTGLRWRLEHSPCFQRFGAIEDRVCLVGESDDFREGRWAFRLRRPVQQRSRVGGAPGRRRGR